MSSLLGWFKVTIVRTHDGLKAHSARHYCRKGNWLRQSWTNAYVLIMSSVIQTDPTPHKP